MGNSTKYLFETLGEIDLEEIRKFFENEEYDIDCFGKMTKTKFKSLLQKLTNLEFSMDEFEELFAKLCTDK